MPLNAPQGPPAWNHTVNDIMENIQVAIQLYRETLDHVGSLPALDCNFESVFATLAGADTAFDIAVEPLFFYSNVSESQEIRDTANSAQSLSRDFSIERTMRIDVFNSKVSAEKNIKETGHWDRLSPEEQRLITKMILDGKRAGLALSLEKRGVLMLLKKELSQALLEYRKNYNEENGRLLFTAEELKGVKEDMRSGYARRTEGVTEIYEVTFKDPDIGPILGYAENPETRKRMQEGYESRLAINVPIFAKAVDLRRQIARLLGYESWADYTTENRMVKTGKAVQDLLDDLERKLLPIGIKDRETLLAMKMKECEEKNFPFDGKFYLWDNGYYSRRFVEQTLKIDSTLIKENFPVGTVVPAVLNIYQDLLGVRFEELKNASTWHPDVQAYSVWEKDATDESGFIGYTYLDLFPRPGKYSHITVWPLIPGYDLPDGSRNYPVNVMLANLAKPTPEKPALMRHHDVVMFFHEMGHVFHDLLSKTRFGRFHGTTGAIDFLEAPSQMLENWCWEPKILERISSHYLTGKPLSAEMAERLVKNRHMNVGLFQLEQLFYAKYELKIHTDPSPEDYTDLWCAMREKTALRNYITKTPGQAAFVHYVSDDCIEYYGYIYSLVFAADMYDTVFKSNPLDPVCGKRYREKVILPGSSKDEIDILKDFLGKMPDNEAFLRQIFGGQN